jgi:ribosomal protein S4
MTHIKKSRVKPLYKQFVSLNENVQNRLKILNFKKQKWVKLIERIGYSSKFYTKYKPYSQTQYIASRYPSKGNSYQKGSYNNILQTYKKFKLFYGDFTQKKIKNFILKTLIKKKNKNDLNLNFLKLFESRLDTILYRAKFCKSIREARQLILHGKILVNNKKITCQSHFLLPGDLVSIDVKYRSVIEQNISNLNIFWPIIPKYLIVNYKSLQIILGSFSVTINASGLFHFSLNLEKLLLDYKRI